MPKHTTPTWEVELLISGVAAFAMVQLPGWLDDAMFALRPRFDAALADPLVLLYVYAKTAAVILASTFVLHLLLRARWIALVGLLSVHPRGVVWDKLRLGPVSRELERARMGSFPDAIERADNLATTVFAIGVSLAWMMVWITVLAAVAMAMSLGIGRLGIANPMLAALAVVVLPFACAQWVDRRIGARLAPASVGGRLLRGALRFYLWLGFGLQRSLGIAVFRSNGRRGVLVLTSIVVMMAVAGVIVSYNAMRQPDRIGDFALFPTSDSAPDGALDSAHYDDTRDPARDPPTPFIPSLLAKDAYLRIVVPYAPLRDAPALRRACPTLEGLTGVARARLALDCLGRLHTLSLDGTPVAARYDVGSDPRTNRPALVAMLDVQSLPRGRHVLAIAQPPDPTGPASAPTPERIPFWR